MPEEKHNSELDSIASFRYQGMTVEQLLISMAVKQDQILVQMVDMNRNIVDLKERKADKTEFTSFETRLNSIEKGLEDYKEERSLAREVDSKELALQLDKRFGKQDLRFNPLESFRTFLLGAISTNGILTIILCGLVIYIITGR